MEEQEPLLHPDQLFNGTIPYPKSLSPSSIAEFRKCPQSFLFQYLYGLKQPTSPVLVKGSMCHAALEQVFDLAPADRNLEHLQNLFRKAWAEKRDLPDYNHLFENEREEAVWGREGLQLLANYMSAEDPTSLEPAQREVWVKSYLTIDPTKGTTGYVLARDDSRNEGGVDGTFLVRGIVDRLDLVRTKDAPNEPVVLRVTDYKTGKAPDLKYSAAMNQKIVAENFFQLMIYALLLREKGGDFDQDRSLSVRFLRLFHLTSVRGSALLLDMDLGADPFERDSRLQAVHQQLSQVWTDIVELVSQQDPTLFVGCSRSFCYCHTCRQRFVPGTVWQPAEEVRAGD